MSLFAELKRRNVIRVGIAYIVGAWLAIQVADVMFDAFAVPDWAMRLVIITLTVGLSVVLFVAWAYELTPEGLKKEAEVDRSRSVTRQTGQKLNLAIIALLVLAVSYLLYERFDGPVSDDPDTTQAARPGAESTAGDEAPPAVDPRSIAVLPFENRSQLDQDVFFVDGIHDDLLTNLARISDLKVISRTTVSQYRGTDRTLPEIAAELGVANVMEGAVQRSGDTVRINVQLIEASSDQHLWAEIYDRELTADNLFDIQSEISQRIAGALKSTLTPAESLRIQAQPTQDLAAYDAYLKGRQALALNSSGGADEALVEFRRAVELDPDFALAWVGLADAAFQGLRYSDMKLDEATGITSEAVERAMALNDQLGEAWLAKDRHISMQTPWSPEREETLEKALSLSPGLADAWLQYADYLDLFETRQQEALAAAQKAADLDPGSERIQLQVISSLINLGQYDAAERRLRDRIALNPEFPLNYDTLAGLEWQRGNIADSGYWLRQAQALDPGNIGFVLREVWFLTTLGLDEEYPVLRDRIEAMDPNSSTQAFVDTILNLREGKYDAALETGTWFARYFEPQSSARRGLVAAIHAFKREPAAAMEQLRLALGDRAQGIAWPEFAAQDPDRGCALAWTLTHGLSPEVGQAAAEAALDAITALPESTRANLLLQTALCHALLGDDARAMADINAAIDANRLMGYWFALEQPALDDLRQTPGFHAAGLEIKERMREQRERFRALVAGEIEP